MKNFKAEGESMLEKIFRASFTRFSGVSGLNIQMFG